MHSRHFRFAREEELVQDAKNGDFRAYDELVTRYRRAVILVAEQSLHSRSAAEDVAQEVFLIAFTSLPRLAEPAKFSGWLYTITRYRARRILRQELRIAISAATSLACQRSNVTEEVPSCPESAYLKKQKASEVSSALIEIKPEYRTLLLLRYEEQWPIDRIANFLSLPATTVNWRLHQARKLLKQYILQQRKEIDDV
jgi:RNA polymerase sigma-70 factor (ECF subfamily)